MEIPAREKKNCDILHPLVAQTLPQQEEKRSLNKGWGGMIGDIYQILNNRDTSVCTAMPQIKGPILCQHRCSYYSLHREADGCGSTRKRQALTCCYKYIEV